ncbi:MAG: hypothetical protein II499_00740 [Firmicutes bacterium]|nr:hypothetical protein [Bacillota bacterium]MBQ1888919.1 hypothetical protein [Bacillota bacterium]MBQ2454596.1 hypothetical protein [Bacillota bacterium]MBQ4234517.1 hypothetical protein [Bacillota bacterium]MBQ5436288.1 hypothetical protein [Bacillota bacterium]
MPYADELREEFPVPILDGITPAVRLAEALVTMGLKTSKVSTWKYPQLQDVPGFEFMKAAQRR